MGRTKLDNAEHGDIYVTPMVLNSKGRYVKASADVSKPDRYRARARLRVHNKVHDLEAWDTSKERARTKLKAKLRNHKSLAKSGDWRADMTMAQAGLLWLKKIERADSGLSEDTRRQYKGNLSRYLTGSDIDGYSLIDANRVPVIETYLQQVADEHGTGAAKTARTVVSSILSEAVRAGVLDANACRDVRPAKAQAPRPTRLDKERSLTREERDHLFSFAEADERAQALDIIDLLYWFAGTGARLSEALGQRWEDIDLDDRTAVIRGTKTLGSVRTVTLPQWLCERLTERSRVKGTDGYVFDSPRLTERGRPRDKYNVSKELRRVFDGAGLDWMSSHTFRRTVATWMDEGKIGLGDISGQLGHASTQITALYVKQPRVNKAAADVL